MRSLLQVSVVILAAVTLPAPAAAQRGAEDSSAIRTTALNYIEGWYTGDAARMESALHPDLAKRIVRTDPSTGQSQIQSMTAAMLVGSTRAGGGSRTPEQRRQKDVTILDIYQNAAVAKVIASDWVDYLQLAKWNGKWVIVNVLWELKPQPGP